MRGDTVHRSGFWPGLGAFCLGLSLIASATVLNIAHDRLSVRDLSNVPMLAPLYDTIGKLGVTLALVSLGLFVLVLGALVRSIRCLGRAQLPDAEPPPARSGPVFYTRDDSEPEPSVVGGRMVLTTRKYLPNAALSGVPSWEATQRKAPPPAAE